MMGRQNHMEQILYGYFRYYDNKKWFWARRGGGLYYQDKLSRELKLVYAYQQQQHKRIMNGDCLFDRIVFFGKYIMLVPRYAKEIVFFDLALQTAVMKPLPEYPHESGEYFGGCVQTHEFLILIPRTYQGFVYIYKKTLEIKISKEWYREYNLINGQALMKDEYIFKAAPFVHNDFMYLALYCTAQVMRYNIRTMEYSFHSMREMGTIGIFQDDRVELLVINRQDCLVLANESNGTIQQVYNFVSQNHIVDAVNYKGCFLFFTDECIFKTDSSFGEMVEVGWFEQIRENYINRIRIKMGERLQDTLYIFEEDEVLYITFDTMMEEKCMIAIDINDIEIICEKIQQREEIDILLHSLKSANKKLVSDLSEQSGKRIYRYMIGDEV